MGSLLTHRKTKNYKISFSDIVYLVVVKQLKQILPYLNFIFFYFPQLEMKICLML